MAYSKKVVDRFNDVLNNPQQHGVGRFDPNDPNVATGMTGAPACGDVMQLQIGHVIHPGTLDGSDNLVAADISGEDAEVQAVANAVWTDAVKTAWKNKLIADKPA